MNNRLPGDDLSADELSSLDELSALYQGSKTIQPPPSLDQTIRTAARMAASPAPASTTKTKTQLRWAPMFAAAATVVLAIGVGSLLQQQNQRVLQPLSAPAPALIPAPAAESTEFSINQEYAPLLRQTDIKSSAAAKPASGIPASGITTFGTVPAAPAAAEPSVDKAKPVMNTVIETSKPLLEPQQWIEKMSKLQQQNRLLELKVELQAFKRYYPTYKLPSELNFQ